MRSELKTIEYIETYLVNALNDAEKQLFEERMAIDPDFKNEVALQEQLMQSLERISLQQTIQNAQKTYTFWKFAKLIGLILVPIIFMIIAWSFLNVPKEASTAEETIQPKIEQEIVTKETVSIPDTIPKKKTAKIVQTQTTVFAENILPERYETLPSEIFNIITTKDTIVETKNGIVFLIPKDVFVDENQKAVNGNIQLEIREALDPITIMTSGLSTLYNDKPLETGGMFFIEARKDGQKLQINPKKEIVADIPTSDFKNNMQLFDGEIDKNGSINWTNPKPLNTALIPQDIYSLNFYPPTYLETLSEKGYNRNDKQFTDSLYYSYNKYKDTIREVQYGYVFVDGNLVKKPINFIQDIIVVDTLYAKSETDTIKEVETKRLGLDPLKIKTIWNERYQNTFIATKAFEERLIAIHQNCNFANYMLDVYLENLDRDLHVSDSIIAFSTNGEAINMQFETFAKQQLTNVSNIDTDVAKLNNYYIQQQKVYRLALEKSRRKIDSLVNADKTYQAFSKYQLENYYLKELATITKKIAKDLNVGLPRTFNRTTMEQSRENSIVRKIKKEQRKRTYRAPVRTTGWKNIDRIINEQLISSLKSRTKTTIKNQTKTSTITYSSYEASIQNTETFDNLFVYVVPNEFNSFIRLKAENNRFSYKLNDLLKYRLYCIAYKNDIPFYFSKNIRGASDQIELTQTTKENLSILLSKLGSQNSSLETEVSYQAFSRKNKAKLQNYRKITELKQELKSIVFPCRGIETLRSLFINYALNEETTLESFLAIAPIEPSMPFGTVEKSPIFPGCDQNMSEEDKRSCFKTNIKQFIQENFNFNTIDREKLNAKQFKIHATLKIDKNGILTFDFLGTKKLQIDTEMNRIISLPKVIPGEQDGSPIIVFYAFSTIVKME